MNYYFEKIDRRNYFISTDTGWNIIIDSKKFEKLKNGKLLKILSEYNNSVLNCIKSYKNINKYTYSAPSLHIIVITLRCNHLCRYCRATDSRLNYDIDEKTLKKTIDFIFQTPNRNITIEFQGGEPLIRWELIKKGVDYIKNKNKIYNKNIIISIVTNLTLMDMEKLKFMIKNNISICTSIDGPEFIHNKNRIYYSKSSHREVIYWFKLIKKTFEKNNSGETDSIPSALMTTTSLSLKYPEKIIDEYRKLGTGGIFIRPLSPVGYTKKVWDKIGYTADEFLKFYEKAIDYIIEINRQGEIFVERNAAIKLKKIILKDDPNFLDLRNPCGAVIGQLAYNYNGDIYTCDEGRMVGALKDYTFKIGNVYTSKYTDILNSPATRLCLISSCLENQPKCARCAFKPYCGVCPVFNYETSSNTFGSFKSFFWCDVEKGIFKILIKKLTDSKNYKIFLRWFNA